MHSGGVHFSHTDGFLSGLSRPPRGHGGGLNGTSRMDGGGETGERGIEHDWGLREEMGHGLVKWGISFARGSWGAPYPAVN